MHDSDLIVYFFFSVERYSPLYGKVLSSEIQTFITLSGNKFRDGCHRVRFLYDYSIEIAGFVTSEYFDVVK
jgi:hypothetical protein